MLTFAVYLVLTLLLVGFLLWLVETAPFISATVKPLIRWVLIAVCGIWLIALLLSLLGWAGAPRWFDVPPLRR